MADVTGDIRLCIDDLCTQKSRRPTIKRQGIQIPLMCSMQHLSNIDPAWQSEHRVNGICVKPFHRRAVDFLLGGGKQRDPQCDIGLACSVDVVHVSLAGR